MALIGINNVEREAKNPSALEKIAMGVDIASKVLGGGLQAYKTFGPEAALQKAQTQRLNAQTDLERQQAGMELYKMGARPANAQELGQVSDSKVGGAGETPHPLAQAMKATTMSHEDNAAAQGALPVDHDKLGIHPQDKNLFKIGDRYWYMGNVQAPYTEAGKAALETVKGQYQITSNNDPSATGAIPIDTVQGPIMIKVKPLEEKQYKIQDEAEKELTANTKDFKDMHLAALQVSALGNMQHPTRNSDLALTEQFIRTQIPGGGRFSTENLKDLKDSQETLLGKSEQAFRDLFNGKAGLMSPELRQEMVNTIKTQYQVQRPIYEQNYNDYLTKVTNRGASPTVRVLPAINFGSANQNQPNQAPAKATGNPMDKFKGFLNKYGSP